MSDPWNPCMECGSYQLKPFTVDSKVELHTEYLVYAAVNGEWDIAQYDGTNWVSTTNDMVTYGDGYAVTHYQELPQKP